MFHVNGLYYERWKEDTIEPGTETLSITADPRSDGLVKARTGDTTDSGTYTNWYKAVYTPTEEEPEEISGEDESVWLSVR